MGKSEIERLYHTYFDTIYRICFMYLKQESDALDAVQETFLKLIRSDFCPQSEEKTKAWLIVTASNCCKTQLTKWWKTKRVDMETLDLGQKCENRDDERDREILRAVMELEIKYRIVIYLYYYEGYKTGEIGGMLRISPSTVQTRLAKARKLLKIKLGDCFGAANN